MSSRLAVSALATSLALSSLADEGRAGQADDLLDALQVGAIVQVMREEGRDYGSGMAQDLLPSGVTPAWEQAVDRLYDTKAMEEVVRAGFLESFGETDAGPLLAYFTSEAGRKVVELEVATRRALIDDDAEIAAREAWQEFARGDSPREAQLDRFVAANDLVEANVVGALNASFQFYLGLVDGGGLDLTEPEVVEEVWMQEDATRQDTEEWLHAYMLSAYEPLSDAELDAYIDVSATPEGQAMNRALFDGFNRMYEEISYGLGLAAAREMRSEDL